MKARNALDYLKQVVIEATCLDEEAFDAITTLTQCVDACEAISQIGRYNQYNLEDAIELARTVYTGDGKP